MPALPSSDLLVPLCLIAVLAGLVRGFSGFGTALVFMPLASTLVQPWQAVIILYIIDTVTTLPLIRNAVSRCAWREVAPLSIGAAMLVPIGAYFLTRADPTALRWALSGIALGAVALLGSGWRYQKEPSWRVSAIVGTLSGFLGGLCSFWGPPIAVFWLGGQSRPDVIRANIIVFLAIMSCVSGVTYALHGLFNREMVAIALLLIPVYGAAVWAGARLFPYASERAFRRIAYVIITGSAVTGLPAFDHRDP